MGEFTYRSARSGSFAVGLGLVILIETVVLHLWLGRNHPVFASSLTTMSLLTIVWVAADYRAFGRGTLRIDADALDLRVGWRCAVRVPLGAVATVISPSWREVPEAGAPDSRDYRNLMEPATPNVLVTLVAPAKIRFSGGIKLPAKRLGLQLDDPAGFIAALDAVLASSGAPAT